MMNLDSKWWQKVAGMTRRELLDELVQTASAVLDAEEALKEERRRESVIIAATNQEAALSMARLGLSKRNRTVVLTGSSPHERLRGMKLKEEHVLMVPGWARGKNADQIKETLMACGVNWSNCRYAPSPETDRAEGLSNWGRTEAAVIDDMLETVNSLLSRTIERTAEKP
jgi:hypothetical protein